MEMRKNAAALQNRVIVMVVLLLALVQCGEPKKPVKVRTYTTATVGFDTLAHREQVYAPIYSEIYYSGEDQYFSLLTTLSVRNTSMTGPMYVKTADYYDTHGKKPESYLTRTIVLAPLETVEFAVNYADQGGSGANFIVEWGSAHNSLKPMIQSVMIGTAYNQGISFVLDGVRISVNGRPE